MTIIAPDTELGHYVSDIVAAYVGNHQITVLEVPGLIQSVYATLAKLATGAVESEALPQVPAVPIKKSVFSDYIICLEDGKKLKMLKRHLRTAYGMELDDYRAKWQLPRDYPMTAPNYARQRSDLAKAAGLGRKSKPTSPPESPEELPVQKVPVGKRGPPRPEPQSKTALRDALRIRTV